MIKEVIVVEGRDDVTAVKRAIDAEVISVSGFGINAKTIEKIKAAQERRGVIVLTDPDFAGEKIRRIITKRVNGVKHAYITQEEGTKGDDIGVENASPKSIIRALEMARCEIVERVETFKPEDMVLLGLNGDKKAKERREALGKILGIGYCNGAQFLRRLNSFGITKEEFIAAVKEIEKV